MKTEIKLMTKNSAWHQSNLE